MKFSFPSIDQIAESILGIVQRFPLVILTSIVATVSAIWFTEISFDTSDDHPVLLKTILVSGLGISFLFALATFTEQQSWKKPVQWLVRGGGVLLLVTYYFSLGGEITEDPHETWYQLLLFLLASHLFAAFAPFVTTGKFDQFWEYNKVLFLRILLSVLYSGVLFAGLSIALVALMMLLEFDIDPETYLQLFLFLAGIFNTWFFLAGVPEKEVIAHKGYIFPKGLRLFSQYVLIPLVTVYIIILYLYLGKIIIEWELPNGWVSNLVLSFSLAGVLSLLLLYPIRNSEKYKWVRIYSKGYYMVLIPLIGLLMLSIWVRISEYGVTVNRYFVATLGVWLTGIVIYFIISKTKSIKVIPISLCLIALGVSFGPLGAFAVSERSQLGRFGEILNENKMLSPDGKAVNADSEIPFEDRRELSSIVRYMNETHGYEPLQKYFNRDLDEVLGKDAEADSVVKNVYRSDPEKIMELMGLSYVSAYDITMNPEFSKQFSYSVQPNGHVPVKEFDEMIYGINFYRQGDLTVKGGGKTWNVTVDEQLTSITISEADSGLEIVIPVSDFAVKLLADHPEQKNSYTPLLAERMTFETENEQLRVRLLIRNISGNFDEEPEITNLSADFFIQIK